MIKRIVIVFFAMIIVGLASGCLKESTKITYTESSGEQSSLSIQSTPADEPAISDETSIVYENTESIISDKLKITKEDIIDFFELNKDEIINKLGSNYKIAASGAEGSFEGIKYDEIGLTFVFEFDNTLSFIECSSNFEIKGAKAGMDFLQIQKLLGEVQIEETWYEDPDNKAFKIEYTFSNCVFRFLSFNQDGRDSTLSIIRKKAE